MYIQIQMDWIQVLTTVNPLPFSRSRARWVEEEEKSSRYFCSVGSRIFLNKTINKTPWAISLTWIKSLYRKAHLRKATIKLITRKNFIFFRIEWSLFVKTYSNLVKIGQMSLNKIFKIRQCIFATSWLSPIGKGLTLYLSNLEFLSPKDTLCQVWLKLAQLFWRKWIFNFIKVFLLFRYYLPLEIERPLYLNQFKSPSYEDALCNNWLKLTEWFLKRRWKCE